MRRKFGAKRRIAQGGLCPTEHSNPKESPDGPSGPFGERKVVGLCPTPRPLWGQSGVKPFEGRKGTIC